MIIPIEFNDNEIRTYLEESGYQIKKTYYTVDRIECDEFYGGKSEKCVEVAVRPRERIKKEFFMLNAFLKSDPIYPQQYETVFKKLIGNKIRKTFL